MLIRKRSYLYWDWIATLDKNYVHNSEWISVDNIDTIRVQTDPLTIQANIYVLHANLAKWATSLQMSPNRPLKYFSLFVLSVHPVPF